MGAASTVAAASRTWHYAMGEHPGKTKHGFFIMHIIYPYIHIIYI
jgi:hypothetical protein